LREILVDDSEGDGARLDREMAATVAAYRDPWEEGAAPAEPNQFADVTPASNTAFAAVTN
jgi:nitrite reductase (NADH) large subunit